VVRVGIPDSLRSIRATGLILDAGTYGGRSTNSSRMPGALVKDFTFTL
jgi:hypothetical protein